MKRCMQLLNIIQARTDAVDFLEPVDWKELGLDDYPEVVKKPMDLGTVESNIMSGKYNDNIKGYANDMELIWKNAMAYNQEDSEIYLRALALKDMFERKFDEIQQQIAREIERAAPPKKKAKASTPKATPKSEKKSERRSDRKSEKKPEKKTEKKIDKKKPNPKVVLWKECQLILESIKSNQDASVFLQPVDWEAAGLDDYPEIVKHPMDLGTVTTKLKEGKYKNLEAFAKDMDLIWTNAMAYNMEESDIWNTAKSFQEMFQKKWKKFTKTLENDETAGRLERVKFCDMLRGIESNQQLGELVVMVQKQCPSAMEMKNGKEITIQISRLDLETMDSLMKHMAKQG
eukprot:CAMPEP_0114517836 /NCGR_PEP_ID=MMETSP0109-20121206/18115_1 /TAXON_ID=29199 /ORGANISM="Chlorarachnion reptans, Strain CCCM449" /LENGTH=344 /DNA_ID=CAMNT_0001698401 /DNA_START=14 /DNA_END=1048 /DNA_ORIENTATION=-